jgi:hypothetical protein
MSDPTEIDKDHWFADFIKTALMNTLQEQVVCVGVCPKCHAKTLGTVHRTLGMQFDQCTRCLTVFVTEPPSRDGDNGSVK